MNSAISVSMTSWRTDLGGSAQFPKAVPPGSILALTLVPTGELYLQSASDELRLLAETELGRAGQTPDVVAPKTLVPSGETRDIHRAGGRYLTLVGSNPLFHLPEDRWPHAVDTDAVTGIAAAAAALVVKLTR